MDITANDKKISIGQMAKLNRISIQTLRYYEKIGLLIPCYIDPSSHYRYYDLEQSSILDIIKYLKKSDLNLIEIKHILSARQVDTDSVIQLLHAKKQNIDHAIDELQFKKIAIDQIIDSLENYQLLPAMGTIILEHFPKRWAFIYQGQVNYYENLPVYEQGLLELKAAMEQYQLPHFYSLNPASITRQQFLRPNSLYCNELFVYVDQVYANKRVPLTEIPGGTYLCIYCDDVLKEKHYTYQLIEYIHQNHMEIIGDGIEESVSDIIAIKNNRNHLIMRVKIPVRFQHLS